MTQHPVVPRLGHCRQGHGGIWRINGLDGTHMGYGIALLRAHFARDRETKDMIAEAAPTQELVRSCVELALSLTATAAKRIQLAPDANEGRTAAALVLHRMASTYRPGEADHERHLCLDLATSLDTDPDGQTATLHAVSVHAIVDLCAGLVLATETLYGVTVADQLDVYVKTVAEAALLEHP